MAVALALALGLAGCGGGDEPGAPDAITVGLAYGYDVGDIGDTLAFRELDRRGVASERRDLGGNSEAVAGLVRGDVRLAQVNLAPLQSAIAEGAELKAVLGQNMFSEIVVVGGPGTRSMEDLRGKRVAVGSVGGSGDTLLTAALDANGMTRDDVKPVHIDESPTRASAFAAGRVDAVVIDYVDFRLLEERKPGNYAILSRAQDVLPPVPQNAWVVSTDWAEEHPELVRSIVEGLLAGYADVYTGEGRRAWLAEAKSDLLDGEPDELAESVYDFYRDGGQWPLADEPVTEAQHDEATRWWIRHRQTEKPVSFEDSWLIDYWRDAAAG